MEIPGDALFKQGAEGKLFQILYLGKPAVLKERFKKKYRNEELDTRLTKERIRAEAKSLLRCKNAGMQCPLMCLLSFPRMLYLTKFCVPHPCRYSCANCLHGRFRLSTYRARIYR